jgi:hypothetical protein
MESDMMQNRIGIADMNVKPKEKEKEKEKLESWGMAGRTKCARSLPSVS